ncbi:MAG TPA: hypothetical protein DCL43_02065, partial [Chitinophagaceae bacterium]|nr:hypothetical protein [Chitinophagaceae bacterium]
MKTAITLVVFLLATIVHGQKVVAYDTITPLESYNFVLGTNTIGGRYQFTNDSKLLEQAKHVRGMGSNILKVSLGPNAPKTYALNINSKPVTTLELFHATPEYKKVFDMDFKYIFTWVHTVTGINWKKGISQKQEQILYDEMFNFASYLLTTYNNTGKTFFIGNWEGDWLLLPDYNRTATPPEDHLQNMTKWFQIRQRAVDDAKTKTTSKNVQLYHYIEVNLVLKGMRGEPCIAQSVLPYVNVDMVSYSSYEAIKNRSFSEKQTQLQTVFDYLEKQLQPKAGLPFARRVYIGEYGYHANSNKPESFEKQYNETKDIMKIALALNLPFALHWQMYNNEYEANGDSKQMSLINEEGNRMPLYFLHQKFYQKMNSFIQQYRKTNRSYPSDALFRQKAIQLLD